MALTTCPECGREVSDAATQCPHCGKPFNKQVVKQVINGASVIYPLIFGVMLVVFGIGTLSLQNLRVFSFWSVLALVGGVLLIRLGLKNKKKFTK